MYNNNGLIESSLYVFDRVLFLKRFIIEFSAKLYIYTDINISDHFLIDKANDYLNFRHF